MYPRLVRSSIALLLAFPTALGASAQATSGSSASLPMFTSDQELERFLYHASGAAKFERECPAWSVPIVQVDTLGERVGDSSAIVRGWVRSVTGAPLASASVFVERMNLGTVAKDDGSFQFVVPAARVRGMDSATVTTRLIGYRSRSLVVAVRPGAAINLQYFLCASPIHLGEVVVTGAGTTGADQQVTNVQEQGVDEGDLVKRHGAFLIVLRRGRLFTIRIGKETLTPTAALNAFGPGIDPRQDWYDELIVSGDRVIVIGYSYRRGGTEIGDFQIDAEGRLRYRATYELRSNDYYSWRNYASRMVNGKLVLYSPTYVGAWAHHPLDGLPALRKWKVGRDTAKFERIAAVQRIYHPARDWNTENGVTLHTVTSCDLTKPELRCESTVVVGPPGRVFYVSPQAVYVFTVPCRRPNPSVGTLPLDSGASMILRLPLDGSSPTGFGASGSPVDQFSFLESGDGFLNVMVRDEAYGDGMWASEFARGSSALLRVPLASFGDGSRSAPASAYRPLPSPSGYGFQNRFVGDYLLYGSSAGLFRPNGRRSTLLVVPWRGGDLVGIDLPHSADRIEVMGRDAVVIGSDTADLYFTGIRLSGLPRVAQRYRLADFAQGETRSHGFFYHAIGGDSGVIGLPVRSREEPTFANIFKGSAAVIFLRNDGSEFISLGRLTARAPDSAADQCIASCLDWYGNARPVFLDGRVFALMGYELIEGQLGPNWIEPSRRVDFGVRSAPRGTY